MWTTERYGKETHNKRTELLYLGIISSLNHSRSDSSKQMQILKIINYGGDCLEKQRCNQLSKYMNPEPKHKHMNLDISSIL